MLPFADPGNLSQFYIDPQPIQLLAGIGQCVQLVRQAADAHLVGMGKVRTGHLLRLGKAVRTPFRQDVPHRDGQIARNRLTELRYYPFGDARYNPEAS